MRLKILKFVSTSFSFLSFWFSACSALFLFLSFFVLCVSFNQAHVNQCLQLTNELIDVDERLLFFLSSLSKILKGGGVGGTRASSRERLSLSLMPITNTIYV